MKYAFVLLALGCSLSTVHAVWLEKTIYLPDSFGGLTRPECLVYNSANNTIYVGGEHGHSVLAIDGATNQKIARIPAGLGVRVLGYNSTNNKIYCANYYDGNVTVVDGATNLVITTVPAVVQGPRAFCYNPTNNKVYFANGNWDGVTVIDGVTDSVTATVAVSGDVGQLGLACNPARNRVYVANCYGSCISVLSDSGLTGVDDALRPASRSKPLPTIVRGVLCLADDRGPGTGDLSALMDACGRKVLDLRPSANDVRALAPGVYFVRDAQAQAQVQAIRKIVITR